MARSPNQAQTCDTAPRLSRRLIVVLAVATGLAVANLYYAQPLLPRIGAALHSAPQTTGLIVTLTQLGYAVGLVLLVPLGDLVERRRLVVAILVVTSAALVATALAPSMPFLLAAAMAVGVTSVVAQILVPLAADLAADHERGRVVGMVMSGLLIGVLASRTLAGVVAQAVGWRSVYWGAAALMVGLAVVLRAALPRSRPRSQLRYPALLASVWELLRTEPILRRRAAYGALGFAAFSVFWTSMAYLLAGPPYHASEGSIGLFGLVGVAGALAATGAGRLADRGLQRPATGATLGLMVVAFAILAFASSSLVALIVGVLILDLGVQGTQILNQTEIYRLRPDARSRITTAYMTSYFLGGTIGSLTSALLYGDAGWNGVWPLGVGFSLLAVILWLLEPRARQAASAPGARRVPAPRR